MTHDPITTLYVSGDGEYCKSYKSVRIVDMNIFAMINDNKADECEYEGVVVEVKFDSRDWKIEDDGLIYTDSGFLSDLQLFFESKGVDASALEYTEHGMQGEEWVSLEADEAFFRTAIANLPPEWVTILEYDPISYSCDASN